MRLGWIATLTLAPVLGACGVSTNANQDLTAQRAQVRIINTVLDTPALDIMATRAAGIPAFAGVQSQAASGYVGFDEGDFQFIARLANTPDVVAEVDTHLVKYERIVLVVSGALTAGTISMTFLDDTPSQPGPSFVRLRLVNATDDTDALSFSVAGEPVADTAPYGGELESFVAPVSVRVATGVDAARTSFTTGPLEPGTDVILVVSGASADPHMLLVPAATRANTTAALPLASDPFAVFVNGVPGAAGALVVDGVAGDTLAFGAASTRAQVSVTPSVSLGGRTGVISGALDGASTYVIVLTPDAASATALSAFAYRDTLSASPDTRVRAINTTVGAGARDVALDPAPLVGSDLVFGAASASAGTAVTDPAAVTRVTATGATVLTYSTGALAARTRYLVLVGDIASNMGVTLIRADWSSTFVPAD